MKNTTIKVSDLKAEKKPMMLTELSSETSTNVQGGGVWFIAFMVVDIMLIAKEAH